MDSGMIGKILKAKQYAQEPDRIEFSSFSVIFHGENDDHLVTFSDGVWNCQCRFFATHSVCSHTMALEKVLGDMLRLQEQGESVSEPTP
jgi:hypothetical protein